MNRRTFLGMTAALPVMGSLLTATRSMAATHPYMGKPFISMVLPKSLMEATDTRVMEATRRSAVMIRDIPRKTVHGEDMVEVVVPKPDETYPQRSGLPIGGSYMSESIVDLETQQVLKNRTYGSQGTIAKEEMYLDHFGEEERRWAFITS